MDDVTVATADTQPATEQVAVEVEPKPEPKPDRPRPDVWWVRWPTEIGRHPPLGFVTHE